jgi:hypothetical protein
VVLATIAGRLARMKIREQRRAIVKPHRRPRVGLPGLAGTILSIKALIGSISILLT